MGRRQKGKYMKRKKSWHRLTESRRDRKAQENLDRVLKQVDKATR